MRHGEKGITLVELLAAVAILALVIPATTGFLSSALKTQAQGNDMSILYQEGLLVMDRMVKKGLLRREEFHGVFLYVPLVSRARGFARFIQFFAERVLELDHGSVVSLFSRSKALTPEEIEELRLLLDQEKSRES